MVQLDIEQQLKQIVAAVAGIPMADLEDDHRLRDELMLDSLKEMEIVARTEIKFDISLDEGELADIKTLGDFRRIVEAYLAAKKAKN